MEISNFTEETCTGTGDTLELSGATTGKIPFSASYSDGDLVPYALEDSDGIDNITISKNTIIMLDELASNRGIIADTEAVLSTSEGVTNDNITITYTAPYAQATNELDN